MYMWYICIYIHIYNFCVSQLGKAVRSWCRLLSHTTGMNHLKIAFTTFALGKGKGLPQQGEVAQGVPRRLRPQIFLTFRTTRVAGRQPYASAAFTPGEIPGTHL